MVRPSPKFPKTGNLGDALRMIFAKAGRGRVRQLRKA
jgi:hypothetical protein